MHACTHVRRYACMHACMGWPQWWWWGGWVGRTVCGRRPPAARPRGPSRAAAPVHGIGRGPGGGCGARRGAPRSADQQLPVGPPPNGATHAHTHLVLQDRFELHLEDEVQLARARLAAVGEAPARAQVAEERGVGRDRGHATGRLQRDAARVRLGEGEEAERERRVEAGWSVARADARGRAKRKELRVPLHVDLLCHLARLSRRSCRPW